MKKRILSILIAAVILCLTFTACSGKKATDGNSPDNTSKHDIFGEFESITLEGEKVDHTALEGKKLTMVNIWATFCGPCIKEMPDLEKISKEYESLGFQIVGIPCDVNLNADGTHNSALLGEAKDIVSQTGVTYLNILPSESLKEKKLDTVYSVPETIFLDENGNQIGNSYIGSRSYDQWCDIIDGILAELDK